jgi:hypothetical protein
MKAALVRLGAVEAALVFRHRAQFVVRLQGQGSAKSLARGSWRLGHGDSGKRLFHHQPEAQHPKSSAIHKLPADYPIFGPKADKRGRGWIVR